VWNAATGEPIGATLRHRLPVVYAAFSHNGRFVVTYSRDRTARVWDAASGEPITPPLRHKSHVRRASFSPDDSRLLTLCDDGVGRVWNLAPDLHSVRQLRPLTELLAARRLNASGGPTELDLAALHASWNSLPPSCTKRMDLPARS